MVRVAGQKVCDVVIFARNMVDGEMKGLHRQVPPGDPSICVLHSVQPLKSLVIRLQYELSSQEVVSEGIQSPLDC